MKAHMTCKSLMPLDMYIWLSLCSKGKIKLFPPYDKWNLTRQEILKTTIDWLSWKKPVFLMRLQIKMFGHFSAPLCLLWGQIGLSLPKHHIHKNNGSKQSELSAWTWANWFVDSLLNHWCNVCMFHGVQHFFAGLCTNYIFILVYAFELPASSCSSGFKMNRLHPSISALADRALTGVAVALPFSRERASHIWKLSGWGSAHSALRGLQTEASQSGNSCVWHR